MLNSVLTLVYRLGIPTWDAQNVFFLQFSTDSDIGFFCFECASEIFLEKCTFQSWVGLEWPVDILQLRPLTVLPILDEFPMSIVQNPLLSSDVRKVARSEIEALHHQIYRSSRFFCTETLQQINLD